MTRYKICNEEEQRNDGRSVLRGAFVWDIHGKIPVVLNGNSLPTYLMGYAKDLRREINGDITCEITWRENHEEEFEELAEYSSLSVFATNLREEGDTVTYGVIREVGVLPSPAHPRVVL